MIEYLLGVGSAGFLFFMIRIFQNGRALRRIQRAEASRDFWKNDAIRISGDLLRHRNENEALNERVLRLRGEREDLLAALKHQVRKTDEANRAHDALAEELQKYALEIEKLRKRADDTDLRREAMRRIAALMDRLYPPARKRPAKSHSRRP